MLVLDLGGPGVLSGGDAQGMLEMNTSHLAGGGREELSTTLSPRCSAL